MQNQSTIARIVAGYLECAEWADKPENSAARFTSETRETAEKVIRVFLQVSGPCAAQALRVDGYSPEQFGHDLWLTRGGHGTGFWDRDELDVPPIIPQQSAPDRNGAHKPLTEHDASTIGRILSAFAYGTGSAISPFFGADLDAYRGWFYIDGSAEFWAKGNASPWGFWQSFNEVAA
jgi:hypothetical protein